MSHVVKKIGVLLLNLGTPEAPTPKAVRQFLRTFLSDPSVVKLPRVLWWPILNGVILPFRPKKVAQAYKKIWTPLGSPLQVISEQQRDNLQTLFDNEQAQIKVKLAMRYNAPTIESAIAEFEQAQIQELVVFPLYPQYSTSTTGSTLDAVTQACENKAFKQHQIETYATHPAYLDALRAQVRQYLKTHDAPDKLIFSYHGLPKKFIKAGDPYYSECLATSRALIQKAGLPKGRTLTTFQSRLGAAEWITPYTDVTLKKLPKQGVKHVAVLCPGFSADCLETLEEINMQNREIFMKAGGKQFDYLPALNASDLHINALARIIKEKLDA